MKTIIENINNELAEKIWNDNLDYMIWDDDISQIEIDELSQFMVTQYENGQYNLEHKIDDFRIENIIF